MLPTGAVPLPGQLTQADVANLEALLSRSPDHLWARRALLEYYYRNGPRDARLRHVLWTIDNLPEEEWIARGYCDIAADPTPSARTDYELGRSLWLAKVAKFPHNPRIRTHAAHYLEPHDLSLAMDNLKAAIQSGNYEPATRQLARIYVRVLNASCVPPEDPAARCYSCAAEAVAAIVADLQLPEALALRRLVAPSLHDPDLASRIAF